MSTGNWSRQIGRGQDRIRSTRELDSDGQTSPDDFLRNSDLTQRMRSGMRSPEVRPAQGGWTGQPWVTPILGSGPLGLPTEFVALSDQIPKALSRRLKAIPELGEILKVGADPHVWLRDFAEQMVRRRLGDERAQDLAEATSQVDRSLDAVASRLDDLSVLMVCLAAQLTRTFHRISLDTCRPVRRWGSDIASMPKKHSRRLDLEDEYVPLLRELSELILDRLNNRGGHSAPTDAAISQLLTTVLTNISMPEPSVILVQLEQVTEVAWYLLVDSVVKTAYPGWTNLLLRLVLSDKISLAQGFSRPRADEIEGLAMSIRTIVEPGSREAWRLSNTDEEHRDNSQFYDAVARTLWAQKLVRDRYLSTGESGPRRLNAMPPLPIAFASSFDYELEMALWRTASEFDFDKPATFCIVMPVYAVSDESEGLGDFVWLEARFAAAAQPPVDEGQRDPADFDTMRNPLSWRLIYNTSALPDDDCPVVVRIVGCPLLTLPAISRADRSGARAEHAASLSKQLADKGLANATKLIHAITVDEYLALRQTERDWTWIAEGESKDNKGFPARYLQLGSLAPNRFWMVMGVPFRDPAVRLRVMSVLARDHSPTADLGTSGQGPSALADPDPRPSSPPLTGTMRPRSTPRSGAGPAPSSPGLSGDVPKEVTNGTARNVDRAGPGALAGVHRRSYGVAINTRVDDEETMLLNSLGFTVVKGRCEFFTDDINKHAEWLVNQVGESLPKVVGRD